MGDDYDREWEHREAWSELRDLITGRRDGSGAVDVNELQRAAIEQARELIRRAAPATDVEQVAAAAASRPASFPAPPFADASHSRAIQLQG